MPPASSAPSGEGAHAGATEEPPDTPGLGASMRALTRRAWSGGPAGGHAIGSVDSLIQRAQALSHATGQSQDEAAAVVVEDLERDAAALTTRTAPLVPACGVLVAVSGLVIKSEPASHTLAESFISLAAIFAIGGLAFLIRAVFLYAGRRTIGLSPTLEDIAFARDRLVRKHTSAHRGGSMAAIGLAWLIIGILAGVHIAVR